jgi:hypothetical protein
MRISCFSCGRLMVMTDLDDRWLGWCPFCQVAEERLLEPYVCRTTRVTSEIFCGVETAFLDHSAGHYPSPALQEIFPGEFPQVTGYEVSLVTKCQSSFLPDDWHFAAKRW